LLKIGLARTPMTILENNCMQSTASSAGYSTGGTLVSAFAAYIIVNHQSISVPLMLAWVFFIAVLGVTMAIPMKRQMINIEQLRFPSGIAAAETLRALHAKSSHGLRAAKALGLGGLIAAIDKVWAEGLPTMSASLERFSSGVLLTGLQKWLLGSHYEAWSGRTVLFSWDFIFLAAGAITGMRVCATMFVSGTLCWAVVVPVLQTKGVIEGAGFAAIVQWTLWFGASCMLAAGLLSFALSWRTALSAFRDLGQLLSFRSAAASEGGRIEAPMNWFAVGQIVSFVALAWLGHTSFGMPLWETAIAVALSFWLALVACRVTGETDTTPVGAMGKVTQLAKAGQRQCQLDERQHHGRRGDVSGRSAHRLEERLPAWCEPASAVSGPVLRHLRRYGRQRAHVCSPSARRAGAWHRSVPGARRPDLVRCCHRAQPGFVVA
jgi:uncharacterized oligopeptide transporter (OPT) family protein